MTETDLDEVRQRLATAESTIRGIKRAIAVICLVLVACLVPFLKFVLGFTLVVVVIVGGVLLFISSAIMILEWASRKSEPNKVADTDSP